MGQVLLLFGEKFPETNHRLAPLQNKPTGRMDTDIGRYLTICYAVPTPVVISCLHGLCFASPPSFPSGRHALTLSGHPPCAMGNQHLPGKSMCGSRILLPLPSVHILNFREMWRCEKTSKASELNGPCLLGLRLSHFLLGKRKEKKNLGAILVGPPLHRHGNLGSDVWICSRAASAGTDAGAWAAGDSACAGVEAAAFQRRARTVLMREVWLRRASGRDM